jgi:hypothetical protein
MDKENAGRLVWFAIGFWAAIVTEIFASQITRLFSYLETDGTVITLLPSANGSKSPEGEEITSLVKETPENE